MPRETLDVAIVGAGAAGLAAAIFAARRLPGRRMAIVDGAARPGAKILVSGGGRCNVTNRDVGASDYWGGDRRFIDSVLRAFPASETVRFFDQLGVRLHEEADGKLFPDTNRSRTVLEALLREVGRLEVPLIAGTRIEAVSVEEGAFHVDAAERGWRAAAVVLATGGLSLPKSGSDGAGLAIAASLGHAIVPTVPALAPLVLAGEFHRALSGVSHEAGISVVGADGTVQAQRGSLLWTHVGMSGPVAMNAARLWHRAAAAGGRVVVRVSFVPAHDFAEIERRFLSVSASRPTTSVRSLVAEWMPAAVADAVLAAERVDPATPLAHLPRESRRHLAHRLTGMEVEVVGSRGYGHAEATAGGVALDEIERGSMESKKCRGLFFTGEMVDVDGRIGGFNFQWAWSSAWVAARGLELALNRRGSER